VKGCNRGDGIETDTTYDPTLNRSTEVTVAGDSTSDFTYDSHGNALSTTDAMGEESTMTYFDDGLLESITQPKGNVSSPDGDYTTDYTYNDAGQPLTVATGLPSTITNTYDSAGDLTSTENADDQPRCCRPLIFRLMPVQMTTRSCLVYGGNAKGDTRAY
jgi:YD repeat-containing protein